jgi:outer membrane lipoprotein-sorting protein
MTRSRMIRSATLVYLVTAASICVRAQNAPARPVNDPAKMKWLLQEWERRTDRLETLDVHIYRVDKADRGRDETHFEGGAVFKSPNLASIDLWKLKLASNAKGQLAPVKDPKNESNSLKSHTERIVRGKDAVWQYLYDGRQIYIFPLAKGEQQRVLDEGPFPFLFKMKANEAEARYQMSLVAENAGYYIVKVLPKLKEDQQSFKMALLQLEKKLLLPTRITLVSPDGTSSREYYLDRLRPNTPVDDKIFQGGVFPGWTVQKNPATDALRQGQAGARPDGGAGATIRQ